MHGYLVSIAMCTYNGSKYIREQIESIVNQSYKNIEIIITDDGSTDDTIDIINELQKEFSCIKFYKNETNLGFVKNFEKAISLTTGEYILLADQDDVWKSNKIQILLDNIIDSNVSLVYSNALLVDNTLKSKEVSLLDNIYPMQGNNNLYFIYNNSISGNTLMFKKDLKEKVLPFPDRINFHDIWIAFVASSISEIKFIDETLVYYRQHESNVTDIYKVKKKKTFDEKIKKKEKSFLILINKLESFYNFLEENNIDKNKDLIKNLLNEYKKFNVYYINFSLFKLLNKNKKKLFFTKKEISFFKLLKMSLGLKTFKNLAFI